MKKVARWICSFLCVMVACFCFAGCYDNNNSGGGGGGSGGGGAQAKTGVISMLPANQAIFSTPSLVELVKGEVPSSLNAGNVVGVVTVKSNISNMTEDNYKTAFGCAEAPAGGLHAISFGIMSPCAPKANFMALQDISIMTQEGTNLNASEKNFKILTMTEIQDSQCVVVQIYLRVDVLTRTTSNMASDLGNPDAVKIQVKWTDTCTESLVFVLDSAAVLEA